MRIALVTDGIYPYVVGGMQKHSYYLAKYLARNGVYVDLYHTGHPDANTPRLKAFSEEELAFITSFYVSFPMLGKFPGHYIIESYLYSASIYKILTEQGTVDFIYAQGFAGWKTLQAKQKGSKLPPIGINFHGLEMFQRAPNLNVKLQHLLLRAPVQYNLRHADVVFSLGGKLTSLLYDITPKPILEIPIAIEQGWIGAPSKTDRKVRRFVFIGRFERRKGVEELHEVLKELDINYNFEFYFIGPIPEEKQLKRVNIKYLGLIRDEQVIMQTLKDADVLVCPSYSEGMPTVILEAMASSLAIIATNVGAVKSMVSNKNGWLIPVANKQALKSAIIEAINLDAQSLYQKQKTSLLLVKEHFVWEIIVKSTIEVVNRICKHP